LLQKDESAPALLIQLLGFVFHQHGQVRIRALAENRDRHEDLALLPAKNLIHLDFRIGWVWLVMNRNHEPLERREFMGIEFGSQAVILIHLHSSPPS
jgi:hypothetical protein